MRIESFPVLDAIPSIQHAFTLRTSEDTRAEEFQERLLHHFGYPAAATAAQPHGNGIAVVTGPGRVADVDALITHQPGLPLIIRCADCAPVFIVDLSTPAIALIHAGKKGVQLNIIGATAQRMTGPCIAVIGPSIGPCHYEIDLWTRIERQLREDGIQDIHNLRICTACHPDRYFSYRAEKGKTGRMFALLALRKKLA